jgi:hypothetical protein
MSQYHRFAWVNPILREDLSTFVGEVIIYAGKNGRDAALREFKNVNGSFVR